jgi:hypothetical protein
MDGPATQVPEAVEAPASATVSVSLGAPDALSTAVVVSGGSESTAAAFPEGAFDHLPGGSGTAAVLLASDDPTVLRERVIKYQRVTAKLKEIVAAREADLKARTAELALLKPFSEQLAASLLGGAPGDDTPAFAVSAKVVIGSTDGQWTPWLCLTGTQKLATEWHTAETVLARFPALAGRVQSLEPHLSPQDGASLRTRVAGLQVSPWAVL